MSLAKLVGKARVFFKSLPLFNPEFRESLVLLKFVGSFFDGKEFQFLDSVLDFSQGCKVFAGVAEGLLDRDGQMSSFLVFVFLFGYLVEGVNPVVKAEVCCKVSFDGFGNLFGVLILEKFKDVCVVRKGIDRSRGEWFGDGDGVVLGGYPNAVWLWWLVVVLALVGNTFPRCEVLVRMVVTETYLWKVQWWG